MQSNYEQENEVRFHIKYNFLENYSVECNNDFWFEVNSVRIFSLCWNVCFPNFVCKNMCLLSTWRVSAGRPSQYSKEK